MNILLNGLNLKISWTRIKRRLTGCCLLIVLAGLLSCGVLFYLAHLALAQTPNQTTTFDQTLPSGQTAQEVLLLIDNSNSMFEKGDRGSDPALLRIQAARLFITYLGVDSGGLIHRLGVIFFGGQAQQVVPLIALTDDDRRAELAQLIDNPQRMEWTNPQAALELAEEEFQTSTLTTTTRRAVVLLTDGKPEWTTTPTEQETAETIARLREVAGRFATQEIALFIILLQNSATDADPEIEQLYVPLWQEMANTTPPGRFYRARHSDELLDIYHDIVVTLTNRRTAGIVLQTQVQTTTVQQAPVEPDLRQVTFVIRKSDPALRVEIIRPNGQVVNAAETGVQYGGQPGYSLEEIWAISDPPAGYWQIRINGQGTVTVWKDFYPAPSTPTFTPSPTATFTPTPASTPTPLPTPTKTLSPTVTPTPTSRPTYTPASSPTQPPPSTIANAPTPTPTTIPADLPPPRSTWLWWLALLTLPLGAGGGWVLTQYIRAKPLLTGVLRQVTAPGVAGQSVPSRLDLDTLVRPEINLGPDPGAYLHLPHTPDQSTPAVRLVARFAPDSQPEVVLVAPETNEAGTVLVNNMPVKTEWTLQDGDVMTVGGYRFKYENLRQRGSGYRSSH